MHDTQDLKLVTINLLMAIFEPSYLLFEVATNGISRFLNIN